MHRFYCPDIADTLTLGEEDSKHCVRVMRMADGDTIEVVDGNGTLCLKHRLSDLPECDSYVLLFIDNSTDSSIGRLRLSTDVALNALLESGNAKLICLCMNSYSNDWATTAATYCDNWTVGCSENLIKQLDLRSLPCCYVLDNQRTIVNKALSVEGLMRAVNPGY